MRIKYEEHIIKFRFDPEDWEGHAHLFLVELRLRVPTQDLAHDDKTKWWELTRAEWEPVFEQLRIRYIGEVAQLTLFAAA